MRFATAFFALAVAAAGCAPIPPPRVVSEADAIAGSKAALEAKTLAPSAFAHAEKLRADAHAALEHDLAARAQFIAEEAISAYGEAAALARVARAERGEQEALAESEKAEAELSQLEAEQARVRTEVDALDMRLKVTRDAQPIVASGSAGSGSREEARKQAARAMSMQAKLLCAASRLLAPASAPPPPAAAAPGAPSAARPGQDPTAPDVIAKDLGSAEASIAKLDTGLDASGPAPIDLASRARAECLSVLSRVRRANATASKAPGSSDALLSELSAYAGRENAGLNPERDERGVSVTLRNVFDGESVSSGATARIAELDRVAAAHPDFGVALVLHTDGVVAKADESKWTARAGKLSALFKSVPDAKRTAIVAGNFSPEVDPHGKDKAKNQRVEVVFVSPEPL